MEKGKELLHTAADLLWEAAGILLEDKLEGVRTETEKQTEMLKEFRSRETELLDRLRSRENELKEQEQKISELNEKIKEYNRELDLLRGESNGRDIYREFLARKDLLPYFFRMENYEAFIISVCAGGIDKFYQDTMREKFMVGSSDKEKEELEYILDRCIELYNRIYPEEMLRRQEESELLGEEYDRGKHEQKGGMPYGVIRKIILRGILSADDTLRQRPIVEVG